MTDGAVLLVGDLADPHMRAVADLIPSRRRIVLDAATLEPALARMTPEQIVVRSVEGRLFALPDSQARGWIRRLAPAGWDQGVPLGSHRAAVLASRITLLAAILREPSVSWLTPVDRLYAAENKMVQYRAASAAGFRVPATMIALDLEELAGTLGEPFVLKPLGPGNFEADDRQHVVYVKPQCAADLEGVDLTSAPFLAQSLIVARRHLRVVTVRDEAWVAELAAADLPLDWRSHPPAHSAFQAGKRPEVQAAAIRLAADLGVGFSAQDWVMDDDGPVFLDLNPGGQWLFLPEEVSGPATRVLADWLLAAE
ncbi:hypothetical protein HDA40_001962 [Hamadaea flava]|uniref:ATP-grasp domain-containing protein n=1 Tax=Hamadaea flava TaxID=1742688 RepID=A0ABV8LZE4_9ACTN|nr:hypothetical protein [Hamadaea flava]MCP2323455.1 hypothetical protein [Hamadaea flava]